MTRVFPVNGQANGGLIESTGEVGNMTASQAQAPDNLVTLADGSRCHLSTFWQEARLVLVFLRHLG
jgi:hypothetical protein